MFQRTMKFFYFSVNYHKHPAVFFFPAGLAFAVKPYPPVRIPARMFYPALEVKTFPRNGKAVGFSRILFPGKKFKPQSSREPFIRFYGEYPLVGSQTVAKLFKLDVIC